MISIAILKTREYKGKIIENYELLEENMKEKRKYGKKRENIIRIEQILQESRKIDKFK